MIIAIPIDQNRKTKFRRAKRMIVGQLTLECESRNADRIVRDLKKSELERGKTWDQVDWKRLPLTILQRMDQLRSGEFLKGANNLLRSIGWYTTASSWS